MDSSMVVTMKHAEVILTACRLVERWLTPKGWWDVALNGYKTGMVRWRSPHPTRYVRGEIRLSIHYLNHNDAENIADGVRNAIARILSGSSSEDEAFLDACRVVGAKPSFFVSGFMPIGKFSARCSSCDACYYRHKRPMGGRWYYCPRCGRSIPPLDFQDTSGPDQEASVGHNLMVDECCEDDAQLIPYYFDDNPSKPRVDLEDEANAGREEPSDPTAAS